ncbi:hypothetical protein [Variovorax sp. PAMC 28711]|uniref:hypothetical protein n=1 Tax=Variovorax sp. PAMC 28711 TaxID=1795631 RepID=UPI00078B5EEB|nr:hypothetical protein [Variovorax sp. PAMC 28711]AMM25273.1 hypothetical protein AX767_13570 [Variovorax sp. PAMC 28711]
MEITLDPVGSSDHSTKWRKVRRSGSTPTAASDVDARAECPDGSNLWLTMNPLVQIVCTALALLGCIGVLLLGQCRTLWLPVIARTAVRARQPRVPLPAHAAP